MPSRKKLEGSGVSAGVQPAGFQANLSALEQREKAIVYLAQRACIGNRTEAELELLRVRQALMSVRQDGRVALGRSGEPRLQSRPLRGG